MNGGGIRDLLLPPGGVDLDKVEEQLVRQAIERTRGDQTAAAGVLGLSRDQMRYRSARQGLLPR